MKKILAICLTIFAFGFILIPAVSFADDSARLQQIENQVATSSPTAASSPTEKVKSITFSQGSLLAINATVLLLNTPEGTKTVYTIDSTKFFNLDSSGKNLIGLGDLKIGDNLVVLGLTNGSASGTGKFVIRTAAAINKSFSMVGKIVDVHDNSLVLADLTNLNQANVTLTLPAEVTFTKQSIVKKAADLKKANKLVVVGTSDDKGNLISNQISVFK